MSVGIDEAGGLRGRAQRLRTWRLAWSDGFSRVPLPLGVEVD